ALSLPYHYTTLFRSCQSAVKFAPPDLRLRNRRRRDRNPDARRVSGPPDLRLRNRRRRDRNPDARRVSGPSDPQTLRPSDLLKTRSEEHTSELQSREK